MSDDHEQDGDQQNAHPGTRPDIELSDQAKRSIAIQELLIEKGIVKREDVQRIIELWHDRTPANGANVVAHAWVDSEYKERLLADPIPAVEELGYSIPHDTPSLAVMENTPEIHHLVVCTLCSCYPTSLLGPPPDWYKSLAYRSRAVKDPRGVMSEFGLDLDEDIEVRVVDSTADLRYLVLPQRPAGTEGMSEEELAKLVTRDSMVGVSNPLTPELAATGSD